MPPRAAPDIPPRVRDAASGLFFTIAFCAVGIPIARARAPAPSGEVAGELRHLQQSVEAIAIEVERISEAQRYAAKVLGGGAARPVEVGQREHLGAR